MFKDLPGQKSDLDELVKRIRLQFIQREIQTAMNLARLAAAEFASGRRDRADEAASRARKTYRDFHNYLEMVAAELSDDQKAECEADLIALNKAITALRVVS